MFVGDSEAELVTLDVVSAEGASGFARFVLPDCAPGTDESGPL